MADPVAVAFEALLVSIAAVFLIAYLAFARMNEDVRRARLYIMSGRIHRFLLSFTLGFLVIMLFVLAGLLGFALDRAIGAGAVFFAFGAMLYGSVEILLIAHPIRQRISASSGPEAGVAARRRS